MGYLLEFKPSALKDLRNIPALQTTRILDRIETMKNDLQGDVKRLTNFSPEYRLCTGNFRVLFSIERDNVIVVYRIKQRDKAYR
jgi:mRNA interferase RelE/StbE